MLEEYSQAEQAWALDEIERWLGRDRKSSCRSGSIPMGNRKCGPHLPVMRGAMRAAIGAGGLCMAVAMLAVAIPAVADLRTDARRESILELRFTENLNLTGRALDAEVSGDTAILRGTVKSEEDRTEAEQLVLDSGYPSGRQQADGRTAAR